VRRLLENGANSSFVHQIGDSGVPLDRLVADPIAIVTREQFAPHLRFRAARDLWASASNAMGVDLSDESTLTRIEKSVDESRLETDELQPQRRARR